MGTGRQINVSSYCRGAMMGVVAAFASSCTDGATSLVVLQAEATLDSDQGCVRPTALSPAPLDDGVLDVDLDRPYPYWLYPVLENRMPPLATNGGLEPNAVSVEGFEVQVRPPNGVSWNFQRRAPRRSTGQPRQG